jgi:hypothetical protein
MLVCGKNQNVLQDEAILIESQGSAVSKILFRFTVFWRLVGICSSIDFSLNSSINNHR